MSALYNPNWKIGDPVWDPIKQERLLDDKIPEKGTPGETQGPFQNTDKHLWPITSSEELPDTIHVTAEGNIGINCGGHVIVRSLRDWHKAAKDFDMMLNALKTIAELNSKTWSGTFPNMIFDHQKIALSTIAKIEMVK